MVRRIAVIGIIVIASFLSGCSSGTEDATIIATVNGQPIYLKELKRELSIKVRQDPSLEVDKDLINDLMDTLVKRQLIIQKAMKKKMAQEPKFVDTIKAFWEQTLIRDFIEYKNRESEQYIFVTEKEIDDYYNNLKKGDADMPPLENVYEQIKETVKQKKQSQALEDWLRSEKKKSKVQINEALAYEQVIK